MKYRLIVKELPQGTSCILWERRRFLFWCYWTQIGGYIPLTHALFLVDEFIERCKKLYGNNLDIIDSRI